MTYRVQLLTPAEAAPQLRMTVRKVREMCAAGILTYLPVRDGRGYLIEQREIDRYVQSNLRQRVV